jgi:hypothetical protein
MLLFSINRSRGYENPSLDIIVIELCSTGGCPLEEAREHCFQIQSAISVVILISFQCYCGECSGYIVVILPLLAFYFCSAYILYLVSEAFSGSQHHPLNTLEKSIHNLCIKPKSTCIRVCRVEVEPCCMNRTMESVVPSLINHTPYLGSSSESLFPLVLIVPMDSFLGPIHGLIQVAHCGLLTINQAKNLYQRFTNSTQLLHSHPKTLIVSHKLGYGLPIHFSAIDTSIPLI